MAQELQVLLLFVEDKSMLTSNTGVQIAQECAKTAGELTVFCRTPNIALPMRQGLLDPTQQEKDRLIMAETLRKRLTTDAGFHYSNRGFAMTTHSPEEREKLFEETWNAVCLWTIFLVRATLGGVRLMTFTGRLPLPGKRLQ